MFVYVKLKLNVCLCSRLCCTYLWHISVMESSIKRSRIDSKTYSFGRNYMMKRRRCSQTDGGSPNKPKSSNADASACVIDSGGFSIKVGHTSLNEPSIVPNCIMKAKSERKRPFIGNQIEDCRDLSGLYYLLPCEKGYITKWDVQKPIWDYIMQKYPCNDEPLIITQPIYNFRSIQECMDEIFFEEYEVKSMYRANTTDLARYEYVNKVAGNDTSCIVVDSGYSFTHVVPYINRKKYYPGIVRIDVGGKLLTNYLKDIISYRQLHVMEETYVINQVKEDTCYVSTNLKNDMHIASLHGENNTIIKNYVLPDFNNIRRGYVQEVGSEKSELLDGCQILRLNNERFTVPELLLHPSNIGMESMGIAEAVVKCILSCPSKEQLILSQNIVLIGGNSEFSGYKERLSAEIRSLLPAELRISVYKPENGIIYPWLGGKSLSKDPTLQSLLVSKYDYEECGSKITYKKFNDWSSAEVQHSKKEAEIKLPKISLLDNMKGVNLFGKVDDEEVEVTSDVTPPPPVVQTPVEVPKKLTIERNVTETKINLDVKNKIFSTSAINIENLKNGIQLSNGTTILPENVAIRFVPISDVCLNGTTILTPGNIKFG